MFLGSVLIVGGLWWAYEVQRRPGHRRAEFRGPALMTGIGAAILLVYASFFLIL